jgi:Zn-dependent protease with chaperone function
MHRQNHSFILLLAVVFLCLSSGVGYAFLGLENIMKTSSSDSGTSASHKEKGLFGQLADAETNKGPVYDYFLGREVAARVIGASKPLPPKSRVSIYVNTVCRTLVLASHSPYQYHPYTCIVLNDPELNAFAAPGGIIFITTGMLRFLHGEDELATVLGHEISHVEFRHGAVSVAQQNVNNVLGKNFYGSDRKNSLFDSMLGQLYGNILNGYSIEMESEADANGMVMAYAAGYSPQVFPELLVRFKEVKNDYGGAGYPEDRARMAQAVLDRLQGDFAAPDAGRTARYTAVVSKL